MAPKYTDSKELKMRAQPEAVFITPAEGLSYAEVLKDLKTKVNLDKADGILFATRWKFIDALSMDFSLKNSNTN